MSWNSTSPDGSISVRANQSPMQQNTTYLETELAKDHFWNEDANKDGHHQFVQMPASDDGGTPAVPTNPALANVDMDMAVYCKLKTSIEAVDSQGVEPFYRNLIGSNSYFMQMLGIRAMCLFETDSAGLVTIKYSHGLQVDPVLPTVPTSIVPGAKGNFTVNFLSNLPSENYLVLGNCVEDDDNTGHFGQLTVKGSSTGTNTTKLVGSMQIQTSVTRLTTFPKLIWPRQSWFIVFGG